MFRVVAHRFGDPAQVLSCEPLPRPEPEAGGVVVGAGIAVEKVFQGGGDMLRSQGLRVESLAKIASMDDHGLKFC